MSFKYPALAALLLAGTSAPAFAQAAGSANDPSETPQSPAEDAAQQAATDPTLEPADGNAIVVTAQRREQTLQDVSASVVATTGAGSAWSPVAGSSPQAASRQVTTARERMVRGMALSGQGAPA